MGLDSYSTYHREKGVLNPKYKTFRERAGQGRARPARAPSRVLRCALAKAGVFCSPIWTQPLCKAVSLVDGLNRLRPYIRPLRNEGH